MDYKKLLILLLGLDANAADTDIEAACTKFADGMKSVGDLKAYGSTVTGLKQALESLTTRLEKGERAELVAEATRLGKLIPHGAEVDKLSNAQFRAVLDSLPAGIVPVDQRTPEGLTAHAATLSAGNSSADAEVARQMGNDPEKVKKYGDRLRA